MLHYDSVCFKCHEKHISMNTSGGSHFTVQVHRPLIHFPTVSKTWARLNSTSAPLGSAYPTSVLSAHGGKLSQETWPKYVCSWNCLTKTIRRRSIGYSCYGDRGGQTCRNGWRTGGGLKGSDWKMNGGRYSQINLALRYSTVRAGLSAGEDRLNRQPISLGRGGRGGGQYMHLGKALSLALLLILSHDVIETI